MSIKTILLGAAAGLVAVSGASAADLPAKAAPVDYVKVCSQYGAGFFVIPGTDVCLDISGYVRAEYNYNAGSSTQPQSETGRAANVTSTRARGVVSFDARNPTNYGTLRSFIQLGATVNSGSSAAGVYMDRAFIQWAGFTFGYTQSMFDAWHGMSYTTPIGGGGNLWVNMLAYTMQFGGGLSATISLEDGTHTRALASADGHEIPDIVANVRIDQAWGFAQVSAVVHQMRYSQGGVHDDLGFAVSAAVGLNFGGSGANLNTIHVAGVWADGATRRAINGGTPVGTGNTSFRVDGLNLPINDGVNGTSSDAYSVGVGLRYWFAPNFQANLFGSYADYDDVLNRDYDVLQVGARGIWTVTRGLDLGLEVLYTKVDAFVGAEANTNRASGDALNVVFRAQRNF
jgi:hypothetical protein